MSLTASQVDMPLTGSGRRVVDVVCACACFVLAVFMFLALLAPAFQVGVAGALGDAVGTWLTWPLGAVASFAVPLSLVFLGLTLARSRPLVPFLLRSLWAIPLCVSFCALVSLALAGDMSDPVSVQHSFIWGGAIGEFIVSPDQGLALERVLGIGAWLLCISVLLISAALMTDFLFYTAIYRGVRWAITWARERAQRQRARKEDFPTFGPAEVVNTTGTSTVDAPDIESLLPLAKDRPTRNEAAGDEGGIEIETAEEPGLYREPITPTRRIHKSKKEKAKASKPAPVQGELALEIAYQLPSITMLKPRVDLASRTSKDELYAMASILEAKLADFNIEAKVTKITQGPVITRYELKPSAGVKVSRITSLENDIAMAMSAKSVRILAPIPGKDAVGIELPNPDPQPVVLSEILESPVFQASTAPLVFGLGKSIAGEPRICDLAKMPHLLIAGATGSGKSVCLNTIICSILMRQGPDKVKFIMIDPKRVELNVYQDIPHLLAPVVNDPLKASSALNWMAEQMDRRYDILSELKVRNIGGYHNLLNSKEPNEKIIGREMEPMPHVVVVIDELADLMLIARNEVEMVISRLAQLARAVGIHLILATQRPSVDVITGIIKANFPVRIAFQVPQKVDSRTILDQNGAEQLLGRGDMLYRPSGSPVPDRLQGCFVSDEEVEAVTDYIREQEPPQYIKKDFKAAVKEKKNGRGLGSTAARSGSDWEVMGQQTDEDGNPLSSTEVLGEYLQDDLFRAATRLVLQNEKASVSLIQRRLKVGFARAGRLVDMMEEAGLVGPSLGSKPRHIIVDPMEFLGLIDRYDEMDEID